MGFRDMSFSQQAGWTPTQPPPPPNPESMINALTAARQFQATQAQANAYKAAIDPTTGQFDQNKYNAFLIGQPAGGWNAGAAMQQAGNASTSLGVGQQEQTKAQLQQLDNVNGVVAPVMAQHVNDQNIPVAQAQQLLDQAHQAGLVNDVFYNQARAAIAQSPGGNAYSLLKSFSFANQDARTKLTATLPAQERLDVGSGNIGIQANASQPGYGLPVAGTGVPYGLNPGQQYDPVQVMINGQPVTVLRPRLPSMLPGGSAGGALPTTLPGGAPFPAPGNYPGQPGYAPPAPGGGGPAPAAAPAPGGPSQPGVLPVPPAPPAGGPPAPAAGGRVAGPGAPTTPAPAQPQAPQGSWQGPPPPLVTYPGSTTPGVGPPLGWETGQKPTWEASGQQALALNQAATTVRSEMPLYNDMKTQLVDRGATVGPGAATASRLRNVMMLLHLTPTITSDPNVAETQAATDQFNHDASLLQDKQLNALGNPTDARQAMAEAAVPNSAMSKMGNLGMISMLQGNAYAIRAENAAWQQAQKRGWERQQFTDWQQSFNDQDPATGGRFDPRVFWLASMDQKTQQQYWSYQDPNQQADLRANMAFAQRQGWITNDPQSGALLPGQGLR